VKSRLLESSRLKRVQILCAAVDALLYWAGEYFLEGFAIGVIVKLLLERTE